MRLEALRRVRATGARLKLIVDGDVPDGCLALPSASIAVMGPQVGYYVPQILMEEDLHGPGIDAKGVAFPGVNLYVQLGHGRDYAWSATSAGQDIADTWALPLCEPNGGKPNEGKPEEGKPARDGGRGPERA